MTLALIDQIILVLYVVGIVVLGLFLRRRAAESVEDYFLAGRRLHWFWISMSGSVSTYDITGTLWIVAMFYEMGLRGIWIHWTWGFMMPAFFMAFAAKWVRRSRVITGAEWLKTRYGEGVDARTARTAYAVMAVIFTVGLIGYAFQGIGKFTSVYLPVSEQTGAFLVIGITTLYVILGGVYSVIFTDVVQTVILTFAAIVVAVICYNRVSYEALAAAAPQGWLEILPSWQPEFLSENENYKFFGVLCIAWVFKGIGLNAGGPGQLTDFQRFLSTRSARDACKVGAAWPFFLVTRWGMCIGITALAIVGLDGMEFDGAGDAEKVLPYVLDNFLPVGIKGLVLAGFIAAFMSTFDSTINTGAAYVVEDIYRSLFRPGAGKSELTWASYAACLVLVSLGVAVGFFADSVSSIWNWLMMVLGPGFVVPNTLRWYWWRFNAWGAVASLAAGMVLCFGMTAFWPESSAYIAAYVIVGGGLVAGVLTTLLTPPTDEAILRRFYATVRPGGAWGPVRKLVKDEPDAIPEESFPRDLFNLAISMIVVGCLYLAPIYAVIHRWTVAGWLLAIILAGCGILWRTWYRHLPQD